MFSHTSWLRKGRLVAQPQKDQGWLRLLCLCVMRTFRDYILLKVSLLQVYRSLHLFAWECVWRARCALLQLRKFCSSQHDLPKFRLWLHIFHMKHKLLCVNELFIENITCKSSIDIRGRHSVKFRFLDLR